MAKRTKKPIPKRPNHARKRQTKIRSKNNLKKTPRAKRLARSKPKKLHRGNAQAGRKKKSTRQSHRGTARNSTKVRSRKTRTTGYTSRVQITNSVRQELKAMTLKKSETTLRSKDEIRLTRTKSKADQITEKLIPYAAKKLKSLGKSKNNLRMVKLKYKYKLNGKTYTSFYSKNIEKFTTKEQLKIILKETVESLEGSLKRYNSAGRADIRISGVRIHAYED